MGTVNKLSRRVFLASQAALAAMAGLPAVSIASSAKAAYAGNRSDTKARWDTATAEDLEQFVGDRFRVRAEGFGDIVMRLVAVEAANSGPHRPVSLARSEGVTAVFESPDMEPLVRAGHQTYSVRHTWLGSADLFLGPVPKRSGGHVIELVLN